MSQTCLLCDTDARSQFDEDRLDAEQLFDPVATADVAQVSQEVRQLISR
jgi:hypothetical protein